MKRIILVLLVLSVALLSAVSASAGSATVLPYPAGTEAETQFSCYLANIPDPSTIPDQGYFMASLYAPDQYAPADIEGLRSGSTVQVDGQIFTVSSVVPYDDGSVEIYPKEEFDGYIVFQPYGEVCIAIVNDYAAATYVTEYMFRMPLPDDFRFCWQDVEENIQAYDQYKFTTLVTGSSAPSLTREYTVVYFLGGQLARLIFSDTPVQIPEEAIRLTALSQ